jgi:hypothetical protein
MRIEQEGKEEGEEEGEEESALMLPDNIFSPDFDSTGALLSP